MVNIHNNKEIQGFVRKHYLEFLEREPSYEEIQYYFKQIKEGIINTKDLPKIFSESEEFQRLRQKYEHVEKINLDFEEILKNAGYKELIQDHQKKSEPDYIFASCYNERTKIGGIYLLKEGMEQIFNGSMCSGLFFDKNTKIIFGVTKEEPQIIAFRDNNSKFERIPIEFENYVFAEDSHGIWIDKGRIIVIASNGEKTSSIAKKTCVKDGDKVGKIIISEIKIDKKITIRNSRVYDPFNCEHHHHINDVCYCDGDLYLSSLSYCDSEKKYVEKGAISKLDENFSAVIITDKLKSPHSLQYFRDRLYVCSSANASLLSLDLKSNDIRLEYKGLDAFVRGMLITDRFFYVGYSFSLNRTNSRFKIPVSGIIQFEIETGKTRKIDLPPYCDNIYAITSD